MKRTMPVGPSSQRNCGAQNLLPRAHREGAATRSATSISASAEGLGVLTRQRPVIGGTCGGTPWHAGYVRRCPNST